jgi:hypothetical protein
MDALIPQEGLTRIQLEYLEMPGPKLTPRQIGRLCGLPQEICEGALALLMRTGLARALPLSICQRLAVRSLRITHKI